MEIGENRMYPDYYICFFIQPFIETLQLITKVGVFDVDDLMMNTVGGLIGWIIYCIIRFIYHKWKAKNKKKEED